MDERRELARAAKAIDLVVRQLPASVVVLAVAGVACLLEVDPTGGGHDCVVCGMVRRHRCGCPFAAGQLPKWLKAMGGSVCP